MATNFEELQIEAAEAGDRQTRDRISTKVNRTPRETWLLESGVDLRALIQTFPADEYVIPSSFQKMMPRADVADLQAIFDLVRELNDECVGLSVGEGEILLGSDPRVSELERSAAPVFRRVMQARVARHNSKDQNEPVARFQRIQREIIEPLDHVLDLQPSVHSVCLTTILDRAAWELLHLTWGSKATLWRAEKALQVRFDVAEQWQPFCYQITELFGWHLRGDLEWLLKRFSARVAVKSSLTVQEMKERLKDLAADLGHMRPLLMRGYTAHSSCLSISPDLVVGFGWGLGTRVGMLLVTHDEREFIESEKKNHFPILLSVGHDGLLSPDALPWINALELPDYKALLAANLELVERLHERLLAMLEQVDQAALVAQFRSTDAPPSILDESSLAEDEAVAAAASQVSSSALPLESEGVEGRSVRRVHGTRLSAFKRVLELLGCGFRAGKGSELIIFRPGAVFARVGQHQKDPELSSTCMRVALRRLGISVVEYLNALSG